MSRVSKQSITQALWSPSAISFRIPFLAGTRGGESS